MTIPIYVVGYPRSGTAWLARLLGETLNSPVAPLKGGKPIAMEGMNRTGDYRIHQTHFMPTAQHDCAEFVMGTHDICPNMYNGEKIAFVLRDPRAVAVSVMFYWKIPNLTAAINKMVTGAWPVPYVWTEFVDYWHKNPMVGVQAKYWQLSTRPLVTLRRILFNLCVPIPKRKAMLEAIQRQSFGERKRMIEYLGNNQPYGIDAQRNHLRVGMVGDWRNHFNRQTAELAERHFGAHLRKFKYEVDPDWWQAF